MPFLKNNFDLANLEEWKDAKRFLASFTSDVFGVVNGNLEFGQNIKANILPVIFTAANQDLNIDHNLGRLPVGYFLIKTDAVAVLYDGSIEPTTSTITLKSSAICTGSVLVF